MHLSQLSGTLEQYKELGVHEPSERDEVTFREQIKLPFLENVLRNLDERFPCTGLIAACDIFSGTALIKEDQEADMAKMLLAEQFSNVVVSTDLHSDWKAWRSSVLHGLSKDAVEKLTAHNMMRELVQNDGLSYLYSALSLVAAIGPVIPATTVDCERGFSAVGRIKTKRRTRLSRLWRISSSLCVKVLALGTSILTRL